MKSPNGSTSRSATELNWTGFESPFGQGWLGWADDGVVRRSILPGGPAPVDARVASWPQAVGELARALEAYFDGTGPLPHDDGFAAEAADTELDLEIYRIVTAIPAGSRLTYREVARQAGRPAAARAVGAAMAKNRLAPMVPCHRVVGSDGSLRGYRGGTDMKRALLEMEHRSG